MNSEFGYGNARCDYWVEMWGQKKTHPDGLPFKKRPTVCTIKYERAHLLVDTEFGLEKRLQVQSVLLCKC